jgi:hypothetical protein
MSLNQVLSENVNDHLLTDLESITDVTLRAAVQEQIDETNKAAVTSLRKAITQAKDMMKTNLELIACEVRRRKEAERAITARGKELDRMRSAVVALVGGTNDLILRYGPASLLFESADNAEYAWLENHTGGKDMSDEEAADILLAKINQETDQYKRAVATAKTLGFKFQN